tara:strand:- start:271 stop:609 length:339 start_codon:yes stop_codon:yes gene_type:complete
MPESNKLRYLRSAVLFGTIVGLQQYIYTEVDRIAGKAFILAPVSLLISFNIDNDAIGDYSRTYTQACILGGILAIIYDIALKKYPRTRAYLILIFLWLLLTLLYIAFLITRK